MYWKLALVQHPMYFIIKEDTQCAERTPPWGEPTIERYIDRVRDNLAKLRQYSEIKIGFEGSHTIHCALYPHAGDWRSADVIGAARSYGAPPTAYLADPHGGALPPSMNVLTLSDPGVASTAVKAEDAKIICQVYAATEEATSVEASMQGLHLQSVGLHSLEGQKITQLKPFQIGALILEPGG